MLRGVVGAWHRGAAGATGKQTALYAFGLLSRCFSLLCSQIATIHCLYLCVYVFCFMLFSLVHVF